MGLLNNGYRHNLTGRLFGATALDGGNPSVLRSRLKPAYQRNMLAGSAIESDVASVPDGYRHPGAWVMPRKPGGMSSINNTTITFTPTGAMLRGYPIEGATSFSITTNTPAGELIVSGSGTVSFSISTNNPLLTASINGGGTASFTVTANIPILGAEASLIGSTAITISTNTPAILPTDDSPVLRDATASFTFSGSLVSYAIGIMEGTTEEAGLTPAGIANQVWAKVVEAGYSAEQILRLLAAHAAGAATGLEGSNPQFTGLDGSTVRIDGSYAAGTRTIDNLNGE